MGTEFPTNILNYSLTSFLGKGQALHQSRQTACGENTAGHCFDLITMNMHSAESIPGQACKTSLPQDGVWTFSGLWCTCFELLQKFSGKEEALEVQMPVYLPSFIDRQIDRYTHTHTHTCISERYLTKEATGGWRHSVDQWHCNPFQYRPLAFAFTMWLLLPQSALALPGALNLVYSIPFCSFHLFEQLPPNQQSFTFFLYVTLSLPLQTLILHVVQGWRQTVPTNMMDKTQTQTTKHTHDWATLESETRWRTALRANRGWDSHRAMKNQEYKDPAIILWFLHLSSGGYSLPTTITDVNTQLELCFLIYIQTFADTGIPGTFFVSFYLKVVIQADLCAGLLFPVHLSGLLQLQLLLLVLSSQTLLLWQ